MRWPVRQDDGPDQVLAGPPTPTPRAAGVAAVVAHEEVAALRHVPARATVGGVLRAPLPRDVGLVQPDPVDPDEGLPVLAHEVARQPDQALHERAALAALLLGRRRRVEDHDLAAVRLPEAGDAAVGDHAAGDARLATGAGARAMQRGLHRGGRDPVRVDDPGLDREHDRDRGADRRGPAHRDAPPPGPRGRQPVERISQWSETRFGGQYVANTLPIRFLRGTEP